MQDNYIEQIREKIVLEEIYLKVENAYSMHLALLNILAILMVLVLFEINVDFWSNSLFRSW